MATSEQYQQDYGTIDNPYDSSLLRQSSGTSLTGGGEISGGESGSTTGGSDTSGGESGSTNIVTGSQFTDLWLENAIRSKNYLPKSRGFLLSARDGYFEAQNAYLVGTIHAQSGSIDGTLIVGSSDPHIIIDGVNAQIGTSNFVSGQTGWRIDADGTAEFGNIIARGEFRTAVFVKDEIHATGGSLLILGASVLDADFTSVTSPSTSSMDIKDPPSGHAQLFAVNDIVRIKDGSGKDNFLQVTAVSDQTTFYRYTVEKQSGTNGTFYAGTAVINYKQATDGFVLLSSDLSNSPYIDIGVSGATPWSGTINKVRLGNLSGITSTSFGTLSGYGLWTENGYFEGNISSSTITGGIVQTSASGNKVLITETSGTDDSGEIWLAVSNIKNWIDVSLSSTGEYHTALVYNGYILRSSDYGHTYTEVDSTRTWRGVDMSIDGHYQTAVVLGGYIYTSSNYGVSFTQRGNSLNYYDVALSSTGEMQFACVYNGYVLKSTNYGVDWVQKGSVFNFRGIACSLTGQYVTAVSNGYIYTSDDYGETWSQRGNSDGYIRVAMSDDGHYQTAVVNGGYIFISSDYGVSWSQKGTSLDYYSICMSSDGKNQSVCAGSDYIYISDDYGETWTSKASLLNWRGIDCSSDYSIQAAAAYGDYLYKSTNTGVSANSIALYDRDNHACLISSFNNYFYTDRGILHIDIDENYSSTYGGTRGLTIFRDKTGSNDSLVHFRTYADDDTGSVLSLNNVSGRKALNIVSSGSYAGSGSVNIESSCGGYGLFIDKTAGTYGLHVNSSVNFPSIITVTTGTGYTINAQNSSTTHTAANALISLQKTGTGDFRPMIRMNGVNTIWYAPSGTDPNTQLSGTNGDICIIAGAAPAYCSSGTTWVALA